MSTGLKSQIHAYGSLLVDDQAPITEADIAELIDKVRALPVAPVEAPARPKVWIAVVVAAVLLLVVGVSSILLSGGRLDAPPATDTTSTTADTTPSTTIESAPATLPGNDAPVPPGNPDAAAVPLGFKVEWTETPDLIAHDISHHNPNRGLAWIDGRYVIPNARCTGNSCVWSVSEDGLTWEIESIPIEVPAGSEYWSWVDNGTVWFLEAINRRNLDLTTLRLHVVFHNNGEWVERDYGFPEDIDVQESLGISNIERINFTTCNYNMSTDGSVFDIEFFRTVIAPGDKQGRVVVMESDGSVKIAEAPGGGGCSEGFLNGTVYAMRQGGRIDHLSADGEWVPSNHPDLPANMSQGYVKGGLAFVTTSSGETWASPDMAAWTLTDLSPAADEGYFSDIMRTDFGWMKGRFVTRDGIHWEELRLPTLEENRNPGYAHGLLYIGNETGSTQWIGRIEPQP